MVSYSGQCYCGDIKYELTLSPPEEARTSICYCENCRVRSAFGITTKVPKAAFNQIRGQTTKHVSDNNGNKLFREFCGSYGSGILEYGEQAADKFRYITYGTLNQQEVFPPKGEFFCKYKQDWMQEIPDIFHKQQIKE